MVGIGSFPFGEFRPIFRCELLVSGSVPFVEEPIWEGVQVLNVYIYIYIYNIYIVPSVIYHSNWNFPFFHDGKGKNPTVGFVIVILDYCKLRRKHGWHGWHCWWLKSCTTWDVKNLVNNGINYLSLVQDFSHQQQWYGWKPRYWWFRDSSYVFCCLTMDSLKYADMEMPGFCFERHSSHFCTRCGCQNLRRCDVVPTSHLTTVPCFSEARSLHTKMFTTSPCCIESPVKMFHPLSSVMILPLLSFSESAETFITFQVWCGRFRHDFNLTIFGQTIWNGEMSIQHMLFCGMWEYFRQADKFWNGFKRLPWKNSEWLYIGCK